MPISSAKLSNYFPHEAELFTVNRKVAEKLFVEIPTGERSACFVLSHSSAQGRLHQLSLCLSKKINSKREEEEEEEIFMDSDPHQALLLS